MRGCPNMQARPVYGHRLELGGTRLGALSDTRGPRPAREDDIPDGEPLIGLWQVTLRLD